jgi:hypothetical protein
MTVAKELSWLFVWKDSIFLGMVQFNVIVCKKHVAIKSLVEPHDIYWID